MNERPSLREAAAARLPAPLYGLLERALNEALRYDPATRERVATHRGRVLAVRCEQPPLAAYFLFTAEGSVEVYDSCETEIDATLNASALGFLRQLARPDPLSSAAGGPVRVDGDLHFARECVAMARAVDIDWEEPLSRLVGDVAARQAGELVRGVAGFLRKAASALTRDGSEFLRHELDLFPSRQALREFLTDVDELRLDTDRLEARALRLRARMKNHGGSPS
jgi:ubiquinone biosynthesis protein UbiJ